MSDKQKVFWISKKTTARDSKKNVISYGVEVTELFSEEQIAFHSKQGEVGSIEAAKPSNIDLSGALSKSQEKVKKYQEQALKLENRIEEYQFLLANVEELLGQSTISKDDKAGMLEKIKALYEA